MAATADDDDDDDAYGTVRDEGFLASRGEGGRDDGGDEFDE